MPNKTIRLGVMAPLTGLVELYGPEISWAAEIACQEVNKQGGVLGKALELIILDDGSLPETAVPAAQRLIDEFKCCAIIGNLLSNSRIDVAYKVAEPQRTPYLNFSFYEGSIKSHYFFHFAALPNQQIDKMIPYMVQHFGPKMFFAGSNYEWPRGSIDAAKRSLLKHNGEIVGETYIPIGSDEIDELLDQVAKSGADVFVPYFAGTDQINLLTRFTELGLKSRMAVVMGHYDEAMVSKLSPEVREGFDSSNTYFMSSDTQENQHYLSLLKQHPAVTGIWPQGNGILTNFGEGTYNCVKAFAQAANQAGSIEAEALIKALKTIYFTGPQGKIDMDPVTHHAKVNSYLARCNRNGTFSMIESFGRLNPIIPERYKINDINAISNIIPISTQLNQKIKQHELKQKADLTTNSTILSIADIAIISINEDGIIIQSNNSANKMFGYKDTELLGSTIHLLLPPHLREQHKAHITAFLQSDMSELPMGKRGEIHGYRKDGSEFPADASISKIKSDTGWILVATLRDITERKIAEDKLLWQATHDPLTQLPNRSLIEDRLNNALKRSVRSNQTLAVLFIDLDGFKLVNDNYGHNLGDQLLIHISSQLTDIVRPGDTVARFGGDEFIILCEQITDSNAIPLLAERIIKCLKEPVHILEQTIYPTASIGIAFGHGNTHSMQEMLQNADTAMYAAKEKGRDHWRIYNEAIHNEAKFQLKIANGLRTAVENHEFEINIQPIVNLENEKIIGAETLLRWKPDENYISPADFVPVAEMTGSILPIGRWVFAQACQLLSQWQKENRVSETFYLSINVSTRQLNDPNIVCDLKNIIDKSGVDARRIVIEITETALMTDINSNIIIINELANLGVKIAVDDFGTGYSSLSQLQLMPVNTIKIDKSFIDPLETNTNSHTIVSAIISMAHALGHNIIAEGVETNHQINVLKKLNCNTCQGYYYYKPLTVEAFEEILCRKVKTA